MHVEVAFSVFFSTVFVFHVEVLYLFCFGAPVQVE